MQIDESDYNKCVSSDLCHSFCVFFIKEMRHSSLPLPMSEKLPNLNPEA
jgi:hypothetical protein